MLRVLPRLRVQCGCAPGVQRQRAANGDTEKCQYEQAAFGIGGGIVIFVGLTYAELAAAMPLVGGEHVYSHRALGRTASFVCTWAILLGYVSVVAFEAVALPTVLE